MLPISGVQGVCAIKAECACASLGTGICTFGGTMREVCRVIAVACFVDHCLWVHRSPKGAGWVWWGRVGGVGQACA